MIAVKTEKLRDYIGPVTNIDIWNDFKLRPDDVIVNTPPKCGTTWTLNIAMMLIHGRVVPDAGNREDAPWLDVVFRDRKAIAASHAKLERRRCIKSLHRWTGSPMERSPHILPSIAILWMFIFLLAAMLKT